MSFSFLLQELHQRITEKAKAHRAVATIIIAGILVTIIFFAVKTNLARSTAGVAKTSNRSTMQSGESMAIPNGGNQNETAMQAKTLKRIENVASILGIAVLTSGCITIYYRKRKKHIHPLPVLKSGGKTH